MKIAVYGLGYVGLTGAACMAHEGHEILGIDVSEAKVSEINAGRTPIKEPGLQDLIENAVRNKRLRCVTSVATDLNSCDMAIVCVGTPSGPDGAHNMSYIAEVSRQIASAVDPQRLSPLTVVYRSTIRPGTIEGLIRPIFQSVLGSRVPSVNLVYNPEFLREAVAIKDYFAPPKIVIGTENGEANPHMDELNQNLDAPVFYTGFREAEFTKFVDNSFHAMKVGFANEIGRLCLQLGISAEKVHEIFVADTKLNISPYYFRPGGAFGGSCLPKDVRALQFISADVGAQTHLIDSLLRSNEAHKHFLFERTIKELKPGSKVLMVGLAFKADSDDLRESPKVDMARKLLQNGYELSIYDPFVQPAQLVGQNLGYSFSHLPQLSELLVTRQVAETQVYDLAIETNVQPHELQLKAGRVVNVARLS